MPVISTRAVASARGFGAFATRSVSNLPNIGDFIEGGYFAGVISAPGSNFSYGLIVSPKAQGQTQAAQAAGSGGTSRWDGLTNTAFGATSAANSFVRGLSINGFSDWYIPAIDELELLYRNLKPTTTANITGNLQSNSGDNLATNPNGANPSSLPRGAGYTTSSPAQTGLAAFKAGGVQCLDSTTAPIATWSSTGQGSLYMYFQRHDAGEENVALAGGNTLTVRAVRRFIIQPPGSPAIGDFYQGGYYAGDIAIGADVYRIIMAPKATGESAQAFGAGQALGAVTSVNDGIQNKTYFSQTGAACPAITWANGLSINGYTDWYIGSRDENELLYRNFKPTTTANLVGNRVNATGETGTFGNGLNPSSVPNGLPYTSANPVQTTNPLFQKGGSQAIKEDGSFNILGNTTFSGNTVLCQDMTTGQQLNAGTTLGQTVRAIRRVKI